MAQPTRIPTSSAINATFRVTDGAYNTDKNILTLNVEVNQNGSISREIREFEVSSLKFGSVGTSQELIGTRTDAAMQQIMPLIIENFKAMQNAESLVKMTEPGTGGRESRLAKRVTFLHTGRDQSAVKVVNQKVDHSYQLVDLPNAETCQVSTEVASKLLSESHWASLVNETRVRDAASGHTWNRSLLTPSLALSQMLDSQLDNVLAAAVKVFKELPEDAGQKIYDIVSSSTGENPALDGKVTPQQVDNAVNLYEDLSVLVAMRDAYNQRFTNFGSAPVGSVLTHDWAQFANLWKLDGSQDEIETRIKNLLILVTDDQKDKGSEHKAVDERLGVPQVEVSAAKRDDPQVEMRLTGAERRKKAMQRKPDIKWFVPPATAEEKSSALDSSFSKHPHVISNHRVPTYLDVASEDLVDHVYDAAVLATKGAVDRHNRSKVYLDVCPNPSNESIYDSAGESPRDTEGAVYDSAYNENPLYENVLGYGYEGQLMLSSGPADRPFKVTEREVNPPEVLETYDLAYDDQFYETHEAVPSQYSQNLAAVKIQRAFRAFLQRRRQSESMYDSAFDPYYNGPTYFSDLEPGDGVAGHDYMKVDPPESYYAVARQVQGAVAGFAKSAVYDFASERVLPEDRRRAALLQATYERAMQSEAQQDLDENGYLRVAPPALQPNYALAQAEPGLVSKGIDAPIYNLVSERVLPEDQQDLDENGYLLVVPPAELKKSDIGDRVVPNGESGYMAIDLPVYPPEAQTVERKLHIDPRNFPFIGNTRLEEFNRGVLGYTSNLSLADELNVARIEDADYLKKAYEAAQNAQFDN